MKKNVIKIFIFVVFALCGDIFATSLKNWDVVDKYRDCSLQQHADVIKKYVSAAKLCGYSDEQILENFLNEAEKLEENNGVLTLSLEYDRKTVYWTVGIVGTVGLAALICTIYYYVTQANQTSVPLKDPVTPITPITPVTSGNPIVPNPNVTPTVHLAPRPIFREVATDEEQENELDGDLGFIGRQINCEDGGSVDVTRVVLPPARRSIREKKQTDFYISHDNRFVN